MKHWSLSNLNQYLIEPSIFHEAMLRNEKAISSALGVIHHKSLDCCLPPSSIGGEIKNGKSYKEALPESTFLNKPEVVFLLQSGQKKGAKVNSPGPSKTLFLYRFSENTKVEDMWGSLKREERVLDIVLPKKKDRFGKIYGFVVMKNAEEASSLLRKCNAKSLMEKDFSSLRQWRGKSQLRRGKPIQRSHMNCGGTQSLLWKEEQTRGIGLWKRS